MTNTQDAAAGRWQAARLETDAGPRFRVWTHATADPELFIESWAEALWAAATLNRRDEHDAAPARRLAVLMKEFVTAGVSYEGRKYHELQVSPEDLADGRALLSECPADWFKEEVGT